MSAGRVLLPALRDSYHEYLRDSDEIADGPTHRFLSVALAEKEEQIAAFEQWTESCEVEAVRWAEEIAKRLAQLGGVGVEPALAAVTTKLSAHNLLGIHSVLAVKHLVENTDRRVDPKRNANTDSRNRRRNDKRQYGPEDSEADRKPRRIRQLGNEMRCPDAAAEYTRCGRKPWPCAIRRGLARALDQAARREAGE